MRRGSSFSVLIFLLILGAGFALTLVTTGATFTLASVCMGIAALVVATIVSNAVNIADQWEKAVVLRLGKFRDLNGPGLFFIVPVLETVPYWIDTRVITSNFKAEKTLTKDTVPVDVDAVLFWQVVDPKKSVLNVADYKSAIGWASQTALRDVIGKTQLSEMLEGRDKLGAQLKIIIDERTEPWGIHVISVEVKDVLIPAGLENAMSMQAQAERAPGARDPRGLRAPSRREVRHGGRNLCRPSRGISSQSDEYAVRGA